MKNLTSLASLAALACLPSVSQADIHVFTSEAAFLAALEAYGIDDFEDFETNDETPAPLNRTAGSFGYFVEVIGVDGFWGSATGNSTAFSTSDHEAKILFSFSGINAVGGNFFGTDEAGTPVQGPINLTVEDDSGQYLITIPDSVESTFRGIISTGSLISLTVDAGEILDLDYWGNVDNLALGIGSAIPEPSSFAALGGALALGVVATSRRRRANV